MFPFIIHVRLLNPECGNESSKSSQFLPQTDFSVSYSRGKIKYINIYVFVKNKNPGAQRIDTDRKIF